MMRILVKHSERKGSQLKTETEKLEKEIKEWNLVEAKEL